MKLQDEYFASIQSHCHMEIPERRPVCRDGIVMGERYEQP